MQYKINFVSDNDIIIPFQYNHILQAALLSMLNDESYARFIHNMGYQYEKRNYKLYTFSRLIGRAAVDKERKTFNFKTPCSLYVAAMDEQFTYSIFMNLLNENTDIRWLNNIVRVKSIEVLDTETDAEHIIVKTVSPISVYSTLYTPEGAKKIYFYSPYEKEFERMVAANLRKKYFAFYGKEIDDRGFHIHVLKDLKECHLTYKNGLIKGYTGIFEVDGPKELLRTALATSVGSRNSLGFGMVLLNPK